MQTLRPRSNACERAGRGQGKGCRTRAAARRARETLPPHSDTVDVIQNPDLVKNCTLKSEGTYMALGEKNALTMAKNAAVKNGGNVILLLALDKSDSLTTAVNGKIYACARRP